MYRRRGEASERLDRCDARQCRSAVWIQPLAWPCLDPLHLLIDAWVVTRHGPLRL